MDTRLGAVATVALMDLGISGKKAAVAAGTAGLGLGTAKALANDGVDVVICGRVQARLDAALAQLPPSAKGFVCDVSTVEGAHQFARTSVEMLGQVDILVTNGGGPPAGTFASTPEAEYAKALESNLTSAVAMCQDLVPGMRERKWGRVLAITSASVRAPIANIILSNTARSGLTAFLKTLSREVAGDGVTVNTIQPGMHATDRITQLYGTDLSGLSATIPAGFVGDPDDFGSIAAFMCSAHARFMTGVNLQVDGGAYGGLL